jgi:replicative DNA helicase
MNELKQLATSNFNYMKQCYFEGAKVTEKPEILITSSVSEHAFHEMRPETKRIITGVRNFDKLFVEYEGENVRTGLREGDIVLLGGMSGMGKTTVAFSLYSALYKSAQNPLFVSLDMDTSRVWDTFRKTLIGFKAPANVFIDLIAEIGHKPSIISKRGNIKVKQLDEFLTLSNHKIIFIDYIDYIEPDIISGKDKENFIKIFEELKILVKKHNCALVLLSQASEDRGYKQGRPTLSNIYGGKEVRSNVDHVIAVYRNSKYNDMIPSEYKNYTEIIGLKVRSDAIESSGFVNYMNGIAEDLTETEIFKYKLSLQELKFKN